MGVHDLLCTFFCWYVLQTEISVGSQNVCILFNMHFNIHTVASSIGSPVNSLLSILVTGAF